MFSVVAAKDSQREGSQGWGHKDNVFSHMCGLLETVCLLSIPPSLPRVFFLYTNFINFFITFIYVSVRAPMWRSVKVLW